MSIGYAIGIGPVKTIIKMEEKYYGSSSYPQTNGIAATRSVDGYYGDG